MIKRISAVVSGRVQMVMFRDFAMRSARGLGVFGNAHNESDGTVTVIAEGEEAALLVYIEELKKGSLLSRVDHVDVEWMLPTGEFSRFDIRY